MTQATDHRRAAAERSIEAILDATEGLLERGEPAAMTDVAAASGVSRVTVYTHFPTRDALMSAVAERAVARFAATLDGLELDEGPAAEAFDRVIASAWNLHARYHSVAAAVLRELSAERLRDIHEALQRPLLKLMERGRAAGEFRDDLPATWLLSCYFALVHACSEDVHAGRLPGADAADVLRRTVGDLLAARR